MKRRDVLKTIGAAAVVVAAPAMALDNDAIMKAIFDAKPKSNWLRGECGDSYAVILDTLEDSGARACIFKGRLYLFAEINQPMRNVEIIDFNEIDALEAMGVDPWGRNHWRPLDVWLKRTLGVDLRVR